MASENWVLGQNDRTGKTGLVPTACLYTIPAVTKPSAQLLVRLLCSSAQLGSVSRVLGYLAWVSLSSL